MECYNAEWQKETIMFPHQRGRDVTEKESRVKVKVSPSKTERHEEND